MAELNAATSHIESSHIESWTTDEVSAFLAELGLEQYEEDFAENGITGDILVHLDHEALKDIGVVSVGHRLAILRKVYDHKIADGVQIDPEHFVPACEYSIASKEPNMNSNWRRDRGGSSISVGSHKGYPCHHHSDTTTG